MRDNRRNREWTDRQRSSGERFGDRGLSGISEQENRTVKKTVLMAVGVLALGVLCYAGRLWAEPQVAPTPTPQAGAAPRTRVALLNLTYVIKNYTKYISFQEEIKGIIKPFQGTDATLRKEGEELAKQATPASPPEKRAEIERKLTDLKRKIEDNNNEAKLVLGKKSDDQMKILYMDVLEAAQRFAISHEFDLVLHYNDAVTKEDYFSAPNIARKVQTGALMPLYAAPGMDISTEVVNMLNYNLRPATTPGAAPATGAATPSTPPAAGSQ
jgi:Skp family chaperone for outer membrane proteins